MPSDRDQKGLNRGTLGLLLLFASPRSSEVCGWGLFFSSNILLGGAGDFK